jgi:hypothetical protein
MEVVRSRGGVDYLHIDVFEAIKEILLISWEHLILVAKKKVSLRSARGMLWAVSIITVRQEENKTVLDVPLGLSRTQELIDDDLGTVCKVTELGLPHGETVWMSLSISQLVSHDCKLRKMRVGSNKVSGVFILEDSVEWVVIAVPVLIEHMSVSMRESASLDILARDSDFISVIDK